MFASKDGGAKIGKSPVRCRNDHNDLVDKTNLAVKASRSVSSIESGRNSKVPNQPSPMPQLNPYGHFHWLSHYAYLR